MNTNSLGVVICEIMGDPFFRKTDNSGGNRIRNIFGQNKTNKGITPKMSLPPIKDLIEKFKNRKK